MIAYGTGTTADVRHLRVTQFAVALCFSVTLFNILTDV